MYQIMYSSIAVQAFTDADLAEMSAEFSAHNESVGITGLLYVDKRTVLQVIEGPEAAVSALYERIRLDLRHRHVLTLIEHPVEEREFPDWAMECVAGANVDLGDTGLPIPLPDTVDLGLATGLLCRLRRELLRAAVYRA